MKYRTDFVTNSSSSSFILNSSKVGNNITVDTVYNLVKSIYLELQEKADKAYEYAKQFGFELQHIETDLRDGTVYARTELTCYGVAGRWNDRDKWLADAIKELFDVHVDEIEATWMVHRPAWTQCTTYEEYIAFERERSATDTVRDDVYTPFTISIGVDAGTLEWYERCAFEHSYPFDTEDICSKVKAKNGGVCPASRCPKEDVDSFRKLRKHICGAVIHSWETDMPQYVNRKLSEFSDFYDVHMG